MEYDRVIANLYISPILFEWTTFIQYFFHNAAVGAADLSLAKVTPFWHWCSIWSCNAFGRLDLAAWRVVQFTVRCWNLELCELAFGIVRLFICKMLLLRSRFLSPILFWILGLFGRIISFINCDWWENVGNSDVFFFPWAGRTTLHKVWHFHYKLHTWYLLISLDQRKSCALKWSKIAPTLRFNILGKSNANIVCADSMERRCEVLPWALWQIMVAPSDRCFSLNRHVWALQTEALSCFFPLGLLCFMLRHYFHEKEEAFEDADFDWISNHFCFGLQMRNPQRSSCLKNYHPKGLNKQRRCATLSWDRIATPKLFYSWLCRLRMRMFRVLSVCENMQVWNPFKHLSTMARNQKHPEIATLSETPTLHPISPGSSIEVYRLRLLKRPKSFSCSKWAVKVALCRHCSVNFTPVGSVGFWLTRIWSPGFLPIGQCGQRNRDDPRPVVKRKRSPQGLGLWISILAWQRKNISVYASQEDHDWLQACSLVFFVVQPAE